ncbi:MAG: cupin domain-containing protein [Bacteroidota bacterium]
MKKAAYWISRLALKPHPEGGYYKQVYKSSEEYVQGLPGRYNGSRVFSTSIYFLLTEENFSSFHRLKSDEIWHFYYGSAIRIHLISSEGRYTHIDVGENLEKGQYFQGLIPHNHWFAAEILEKKYGLVGCTVAPGFSFEDFELADRAALIASFPQHEQLITRFTRL